MPVIVCNGDLLKSDCDVIIHQANCFHIMGGGIARLIKDQFPEAYLADQRTIKGDNNKLGTFSWARSKGKIICNMYSQYHIDTTKCVTNYEAMVTGFTAIKKHFEIWKTWPKIGLPYGIGCNRGGGNWSVVEKIIETTFYDKDVYIYKLNG